VSLTAPGEPPDSAAVGLCGCLLLRLLLLLIPGLLLLCCLPRLPIGGGESRAAMPLGGAVLS
jgi:hypothetical protein